MAGINVLSDSLKGGNKLEKTSTLKGKDVVDSPENAAALFASMLSGSMNLNVDPKGQNSSSIAGQESEEKQSAGNPVQSVQNPNGQGSMLGYGNFVLPFITQPMLQSDIPAGKEANSGDVVSQGTGEVLPTDAQWIKAQVVPLNNNPSLSISSEVSPVSDEVFAATGMATSKLQGDDPEITELDKYREVIAGLLEALSGEIRSSRGNPLSSVSGIFNLNHNMEKLVQAFNNDTDAQLTRIVEGTTALQPESSASANSPISKVMDGLQVLYREIQALSLKGNSLSSESTGIKDLGLDVMKIAQEWKMVTDEVAKNGQISLSPKENSISSENNGIMHNRQVITKIAQDLRTFAGDVARNGQVTNDQRGLKPLLDVLSQWTEGAKATQQINGVEGGIVPTGKGSSEPLMEHIKGTDVDSDGAQVRDTAFPKNIHSTQTVEPSSDVQIQNSSAGIGVVSNTVAENVAGGKTVAIPVWEQISIAFREHVLNRHQDLKELDIQLHPADLGKIQIAMRWENGQVHLQLQASEASTGRILQNQLSDLRNTLTDQGVNCGMFQMGQGGDQGQNHRGDDYQRTLNHNLNVNEDGEPIPVIKPLSLGQVGNNRINVTA